MKELIDRIHSSKNFLVTSHINPDGDNVGSSVAMTKFLKNIGKNAIHGLNDQIPDNLNFLMQDHKIYMEKEGKKIVEPGKYRVYAGGSCMDERVCAEIEL